jgi:hypothetical protein
MVIRIDVESAVKTFYRQVKNRPETDSRFASPTNQPQRVGVRLLPTKKSRTLTRCG